MQVSATVPVNPPTGAIDRVTVPEDPGTIEIEVTEDAIVVGEDDTVRV